MRRKLDEEYKERVAALKNELRREREQILQQAGKQRVELEQEMEKLKTEENYLRDRLTLALKVTKRWPQLVAVSGTRKFKGDRHARLPGERITSGVHWAG